ncbi:TagF domain-containing protein [Psychrobacter sp. HII-4]|uniref:TagF domain-containing protein n=1 Tax=Psychrobacter sp. HII-4 TaxID=1569264 RepID=UPI001917C91C|nr:TagF domain-containing protein [Psychrobacter sp. HII-4]
MMCNIERIHYFGKLRRRREFIKAAGLTRDYYYDWEVWFNKCSNTNTLLSFLNTTSKTKPVWLFVVSEGDTLKIGLTTLSSDMSERKYPFFVYVDTEKTQLNDLEKISTFILSMAGKYEGFVNIVANGDLKIEETHYFSSYSQEYEGMDQLKVVIDDIALEVLERGFDPIMCSYWVNLEKFITITHQGYLTCTLYNKIYG